MQILTGLVGMMVSRPECMTSLKTCHFSSQLTKGVNNRGQFICVRYLPNAALMLVLKSCLMEIFLLLMLRFSGSVEMCLLSQQPSWQRRSWIYESHYWCTAVWCRRMRKKCPNQSPLILNHEHVLLFPIIPMFDNSRFPVNISGSMFDFTRTQTWFFNVLLYYVTKSSYITFDIINSTGSHAMLRNSNALSFSSL